MSSFCPSSIHVRHSWNDGRRWGSRTRGRGVAAEYCTGLPTPGVRSRVRTARGRRHSIPRTRGGRCRGAALDPSSELGTAGRRDRPGNLPGLTAPLELGHELRSAIDLDRLDRNRHPGDQLIQKRGGGPRRGGRPDPDHGTPRDHIDRRELPPLDAGQRPQVRRGCIVSSWISAPGSAGDRLSGGTRVA